MSIVIPTRNEEAIIEKNLKKIYKFMKNLENINAKYLFLRESAQSIASDNDIIIENVEIIDYFLYFVR